ncbi:hypothetical protein HMSSN139_18640 [Paenibacillus sp. HMSSN-139]|nr:hypothetical protein HMSSN139_18640 [Paenibacillus sp. HMSSN-139]
MPIQTEAGWLILYHGADRTHRYCMGAALLDLQDPGRVIARMEEPLIVPESEYETSGFSIASSLPAGRSEEESK